MRCLYKLILRYNPCWELRCWNFVLCLLSGCVLFKPLWQGNDLLWTSPGSLCYWARIKSNGSSRSVKSSQRACGFKSSTFSDVRSVRHIRYTCLEGPQALGLSLRSFTGVRVECKIHYNCLSPLSDRKFEKPRALKGILRPWATRCPSLCWEFGSHSVTMSSTDRDKGRQHHTANSGWINGLADIWGRERTNNSDRPAVQHARHLGHRIGIMSLALFPPAGWTQSPAPRRQQPLGAVCLNQAGMTGALRACAACTDRLKDKDGTSSAVTPTQR